MTSPSLVLSLFGSDCCDASDKCRLAVLALAACHATVMGAEPGGTCKLIDCPAPCSAGFGPSSSRFIRRCNTPICIFRLSTSAVFVMQTLRLSVKTSKGLPSPLAWIIGRLRSSCLSDSTCCTTSSIVSCRCLTALSMRMMSRRCLSSESCIDMLGLRVMGLVGLRRTS